MDSKSFREANSCSVCQKIPRIHNSPPPALTLSDIDPVHPTSRSVLILFSHPCMSFPSDLIPSGFCTKPLYTSLLSTIRATCPAHLSLLDLIT